MENIQLKLSVNEINLILEALGNQPFVQVHQLISKIQQQAESQLQLNTDKEGENPEKN